MTQREFSVGQALDLKLLTDGEVIHLMTLERQFDWMQPAIESPHALLLTDALQLCRKEHAMHKLVYGVGPDQQDQRIVNLTMKIIQAMDMIPSMFGNQNRVVEHIVGDTYREDYKFVVVPHNFSDVEIQEFVESDHFGVVIRDLQYTNTTPE